MCIRDRYRSERTLSYTAGLPKREWFKHLVYAPGFYTGYGVKTLPGIREGLEQNALDEALKFISVVSSSLDDLSGQIESAEAALSHILQ